MHGMERCDIAIIGAGLAGSVAACLIGAGQPGRRIILCDADLEPRHKPCGEYLSPGGVAVLERAGLLPEVLATGAQPLSAVAMRTASGGTRVPFAPVLLWSPQAGNGLGVRRERLDRSLQLAAARHAGLRTGIRLLSARREGGLWQLSFDDGSHLQADTLVGADGRGSTVRRLCGLDRKPVRRRFALVARAHGVAHGDSVEMHLGPLGQIGLCPLGNGEVNLNLLIAPDSACLLQRMPRDRLLRAAMAATPSLGWRTTRAMLGPVLATGSLPQGCRAVTGEGLALIGDAAGFCDPFTGEGMSLALAEAEMLATALAGDGLPAYAGAFQRLVGRRRSIGEALQGLLARRRISEVLVTLLGRLPIAARLLVADAAGYRRSA
jgi:menaquinone-9 beta-reductase